ncbi:MAG: cupin domain-containing protein [Desulfovibrio sp.]
MIKDEKRVQIPLCDPYVDERGKIQVLLNSDELESAVIIESKKGAIRANHYHTSDWHYCYVVSGSIEYYWRPTGSEEEPQMQVFKAGELFFTPPMVDHTMVFPEDGTFLTLSGSNREKENYDDEIVHVELVKP